ncbi:DUF6232 family protein [Paraburkholderia caledonica]
MRVDPAFRGTSAAETAEKVFLETEGIAVTNARFIVPGQTYAMSGITAIAHREKSSSRVGGLSLALLAIVIAVSWEALRPMAAVMLVVGVLWALRARGRYDVILNTSSGQLQAFSSPDREFVRRIVSALNEAIVFRG